MITLKPTHQKMASITLDKRRLSIQHSSESGFTLIESLMAVIVVSVLLVGIFPIIAFSVGTRVQARRVELATQAAKTYIDGVRSGAIVAPPINNTSTTTLTSILPPISTGTLTCASNAYCSAPTPDPTFSLYCINGDDTDGCSPTSLKDMVVQAFGYNSSSTTADSGYSLGVRVYRADAFRDATPSLKTTNPKKAQTFGGGIGDRKLPLIEITTDIITTKTKFKDFCNRISGSSC
jgi:prepilin-type N-terminal cleavage/methylation domain-containing protein